MRRLLPVFALAVGALARQAAAQAPHVATDSGRQAYTAADVHFMSGMILHHAQAVQIAGWAKTHDAGPALRALCDRIVVGQTDEIALLTRWLEDRHEPAMGAHLMPGMLTPDQLAELDRARGPEFDRLFLRFMIQHHQGAITMVQDLFAAAGGEEENVYRMAANIFADQTTEIERMQRMLAAMLFEGRRP
jgi:uncharacterized protein (DUF305 family)